MTAGFSGTMVATVVAIASLAAACSSPSTLTLDEYVDAASASTNTYVDQTQSLGFSFQRTVEDGVAAIAARGGEAAVKDATDLVRTETVKYLGLLDDAMLQYVEDLGSLRAPEAITADHDAYLAIIESVEVSLQPMREMVDNAASIADIQAALVGSGFSDGQKAWVAVCKQLEQRVRDEGRGIDLKCEPRAVTLDEGGSP